MPKILIKHCSAYVGILQEVSLDALQRSPSTGRWSPNLMHASGLGLSGPTATWKHRYFTDLGGGTTRCVDSLRRATGIQVLGCERSLRLTSRSVGHLQRPKTRGSGPWESRVFAVSARPSSGTAGSSCREGEQRAAAVPQAEGGRERERARDEKSHSPKHGRAYNNDRYRG